MPRNLFLLLVGLFWTLLPGGLAASTIAIQNGPTGRSNVIQTLLLAGLEQSNGTLKNSEGGTVLVQDGIFIIPLIKAGEQLSYTFKPDPDIKQSSATVKATEQNQKVTFIDGDSPLLVYQGRETELPRAEIKPQFKRGGYIHPVFSPSGRIVSDDYPPNHVHHHGIWFPWTKTEFEGRHPDFWNMGDGKGKVEFAGLGTQWSGPVHSGLTASHQFIDLTSGAPLAALNETWTIRSYGLLPGPIPANVFDLQSVQSTASDSPLKLPKYYYGGLGFRGNWAWNGEGNTEFLSSEGTTNRLAGNETRANWCYIGGQVDGQQTGVAILGHPENFRAPQPMRWHPKEPFFCYSPSQLGDWEIKPGAPYISRYRFVVFDGKPNRAWIESMWQNYAHPLKISSP